MCPHSFVFETPNLQIAYFIVRLSWGNRYNDFFSNCGVALSELNRLEDTLASYDHALAIKPGNAKALNNRGNALKNLYRLDEAWAI